MDTQYSVRPAVESDQAAIFDIVREARIYPRQLHWQRFRVAEAGDQVVGVGQVRLHRDGSRELASVAVRRAYRGRGIGSSLCRELVEPEAGPLFLVCRHALQGFYARFGFRKVAREQMSRHFRRLHTLLDAASRVVRPATSFQLIVMKRGD
jgi:N-acetylglutamate synthase-like GNAT family acetyltransferase